MGLERDREKNFDGSCFSSFHVDAAVLLLHYLIPLTMLAIGVTVYIWMTPYKELELIRGGNVAAAISARRGDYQFGHAAKNFSMAVSVGRLGYLHGAW